MSDVFLPVAAPAIPLDLVSTAGFDGWFRTLSDAGRGLVQAAGFKGRAGQVLVVPDVSGSIERVAAGLGEGGDSYAVAGVPNVIPAGDYRFDQVAEGVDPFVAAVAWADGAYRFSKYKKSSEDARRLVVPDGIDGDELMRQAEAIDWLRDLVNTPACDLGPSEIVQEATALAKEFGAEISVVEGDELKKDYPLVHAVGRAATDGPKYIEMVWGREDAPVLALVGKGVAFDTGGLNLKTGDYMTIMKKDMGGAAHVLALARLVMGAKLDVRLVLCVPAVENAIGAGAFRPGDVLSSRKGLTVEIGNTDAEGRLVLADALARACEFKPAVLIDFATLTGAARVALGSDLAPIYTDDETIASDVLTAGRDVEDPMWRMPLYAPYKAGLSSPIADLRNISDGPMGGSITADLFLQHFVDTTSWAHFDVWAWRPPRYGRPAGATANGLRAVWGMLKARFG